MATKVHGTPSGWQVIEPASYGAAGVRQQTTARTVFIKPAKPPLTCRMRELRLLLFLATALYPAIWLVPATLQAAAPGELTGHSVARQWNEVLLQAIRRDFARPTVHARNLFHVSGAMWDAFASYDSSL